MSQVVWVWRRSWTCRPGRIGPHPRSWSPVSAGQPDASAEVGPAEQAPVGAGEDELGVLVPLAVFGEVIAEEGR